MTEQRNPDVYGHQLELRRKREAWQEEQKRRKESEQRAEKQARVEAHLRRRSEAYQDTVGSPPTTTVVQEWVMQYTNRQEQEHQAARAAKLAEAKNQPHYHPGI